MSTKAKQPPPVIVNDDDQAPEMLASSIRKTAESAERLLNSGLTMRAICVLIRDATNLPLGEIERVLRAARELSRYTIQLKHPVTKPKS